MFFKGVIQRFIPFVLTFTAGLFVASLFVPIAFTNWNLRRGVRHRPECRRMKVENVDLREENARIRREMEDLRRAVDDAAPGSDLTTPPATMDSEPPPPPPPPARPARMHKTVR